jgi:hypothetical protein
MTGCKNVQMLTKDEIDLAIKTESIFMPLQRRQRDEAFKNQNKAGQEGDRLRFVHYTSADAALNIIKSKRIWMRNVTCMADYREVVHGFDIFNKFLSTPDSKGEFVSSIETCAKGAAEEAIALFNQWWKDIRFNTYITSISEHSSEEDRHGRLSMWRAFGGASARVGIVISVPWFSGAALALKLMFSPVAYLGETEAVASIREALAKIRENCDFLKSLDRGLIVANVFTMLLAGVTCIKHEGFREEREWRAIYSPNRLRSPFMEGATQSIGGIPQRIYKIPLDQSISPEITELDFSKIFDRLIIGPTAYSWVLYEAFRDALADAGVQNANERVCASNIPIRA